MKKITEIYKEYKIPPNLQLHQLRVSAVASMICDSFGNSIDKNKVLTATLLHDMGNIIKFQLEYFPEFLEPEGLEYWQKVQNEFIEKYGNNEHNASLAILKELNVSQEISDIVGIIGYPYVEFALESPDFHKKIATYSDFRVSPHGVLSIEERAIEGMKRYANKVSDANKKEREEKHKHIEELEGQIFSNLNIKPEDLNDENIKNIIEELKGFTF